MADSLRAKLNPIYTELFPDLFDRPEVVETRATCDTCAMCDHGQLAPVAMDYFKPDAKCCTYHPSLANYLVGAILADESAELAEGRRRLRAKIAARIGITPKFVAASRKYNLVTTAARGSGFFGRSKVALCPYFDRENNGRCTVWQYREAVCSTYFCKYTAGKPGWAFWDAMKGYLSTVEKMLAHWSAMSVDGTVTEPDIERFTLTAEDLEDLPPKEADYARYWGKWVGREEEFYIACYQRVSKLEKAEFSQQVDDSPAGRGILGELTSRYAAITSLVLPESLVRNPKMKTRATEDAVVITTYNPFDAFSVEKDLYEVLGLLDEKQTLEQNLARLTKEHEIELAPELLQYLFVHGVLVAPEPAAPEARTPEARTPANRQERRSVEKKKKKKRT